MENIETEKYFVAQGMRKFGGSFITALGEALAHADTNNTRKIKETWKDYWKEYIKIGQE